MNHSLFSCLILLAVTLLISASPEQTNAYDRFPGCSKFDPDCRGYDFPPRRPYRIPVYDHGYRPGCPLNRYHDDRSSYRRFSPRNHYNERIHSDSSSRFFSDDFYDRPNREPLYDLRFNQRFNDTFSPKPPPLQLQENSFPQMAPFQNNPQPVTVPFLMPTNPPSTPPSIPPQSKSQPNITPSTKTPPALPKLPPMTNEKSMNGDTPENPFFLDLPPLNS